MAHPYSSLPATSYWRKSVSGRAPHDIDPMVEGGVRIDPLMKVATAGSCFAQRISRRLQDLGYNFFQAETAPDADRDNPYYGMFSAAYGNVYTTTQLRQLMLRAYGLLGPVIDAWRTSAGNWLDPFRPGLKEGGFATKAEMLSLQERHLACVRRMLEHMDVFVFTLGLTEAWVDADDVVVPLVPGAADAQDYGQHYRFINMPVARISGDFLSFVDDLKLLNPKVEVILTVSPVPIIATYEQRHVIVSNMYSKSALRAAAGEITAARKFVHYFPSYEMLAGHHSRAAFYREDLREVTPDGVGHVMSLFSKHFLKSDTSPGAVESDDPERHPHPSIDPAAVAGILRDYRHVAAVVCDEERLA